MKTGKNIARQIFNALPELNFIGQYVFKAFQGRYLHYSSPYDQFSTLPLSILSYSYITAYTAQEKMDKYSELMNG